MFSYFRKRPNPIILKNGDEIFLYQVQTRKALVHIHFWIVCPSVYYPKQNILDFSTDLVWENSNANGSDLTREEKLFDRGQLQLRAPSQTELEGGRRKDYFQSLNNTPIPWIQYSGLLNNCKVEIKCAGCIVDKAQYCTQFLYRVV